MKNILLPTDFSENSWNAIKYALQLFKDETCKFYLLNTYTPLIYHVEYVVIEPTQLGILDNVRETSLKNLQDFKTRMESEFKNPKHNIGPIGAFNMLIPEIVDVVKNKAINYVVMGTKGATGASEILFGSNTVHVFKSVKCPILAIPNGFEFEKPHEILFPTDYEIDYKPYHLKSIIEIASLFKNKLPHPS